MPSSAALGEAYFYRVPERGCCPQPERASAEQCVLLLVLRHPTPEASVRVVSMEDWEDFAETAESLAVS
jgi:hypothetical protein